MDGGQYYVTGWCNGCECDSPSDLYPLIPPNPIDCTVNPDNVIYFKGTIKMGDDLYYHTTGGTHFSNKMYASDGSYIGNVTPGYSANMIGYAARGENYIYTCDAYRYFYKYNIETNTSERIQFGCYDILTNLNYTSYISWHDGYIILGGNQFLVNGSYYSGAVILNENFDYVDLIDNGETIGTGVRGALVINGRILMIDTEKNTRAGAPLRMHDIYTREYLGDLPAPSLYAERRYGSNIIDLGIVNGKGLFAVVSSLCVYNSFGNGLNIKLIPYYKDDRLDNATVNKFTLYDYDWNMIGDYSSPIDTGELNTGFGVSITRYGNYFIVGEPYLTTSQGIIEGGALHVYTDDGVFVETLSNWDVAKVNDNFAGGAGVIFDKDFIGSFGGGYNGDFSRICGTRYE